MPCVPSWETLEFLLLLLCAYTTQAEDDIKQLLLNSIVYVYSCGMADRLVCLVEMMAIIHLGLFFGYQAGHSTYYLLFWVKVRGFLAHIESSVHQ